MRGLGPLLLERRTERDPQVITLSQNIANLEQQLLPLGRTYAESLERQGDALRREADALRGRLSALPRQAQGSLRDQRDVKLLSQTEAALQSQLIESALDGEDHLTEPVSAERARRRIVGVDGLGVDALVER